MIVLKKLFGGIATANKPLVISETLYNIMNKHHLTLLSKQRETEYVTAYSAHSAKNETVAVEIIKNENTSSWLEDAIHFKNDIAGIMSLTASGKEKPHALQEIYTLDSINNTKYLIYNYTPGSSLKELLNKNFAWNNALRTILSVLNGLASTHAIGIKHLAITPESILVPIEEGKRVRIDKARLVDFGLAHLKKFEAETPKQIINTFGYIAPEQTRLFKATADESSDIYALGIILYQLIAHRHPFLTVEEMTRPDRNNLIHKQAVQTPPRLIAQVPGLPVIVEQLVFKMIEKDVDVRYKTVNGLIADISTILQADPKKVAEGEIDFALGLADKQNKLNFHATLTGREDEKALVLDGYSHSLQGQGSIFMVGGEAGQGKSRLVDDIRLSANYDQKTVLSGKFFNGETKAPYQPFKEACTTYVDRFNKYPAGKKSVIQKTLLTQIGDFGRLIIRFAPELTVILGLHHPEIPALDSTEKENERFIAVIANFFFALAQAEAGIILILDDFQWADSSSIALLQKITQSISAQPLYILGTYRNNELTPDSPFQKLLSSNTPALKNIALQPFDINKLTVFIQKLLHEKNETAELRELASFIFERSKGNPFFSIEILKQLVENKSTYFADAHWHFDSLKAEKVHIPATIIDVILNRIQNLADDEIDVLTTAAIVGHKFSSDLLFKLCPHIEHAHLVEIVDKGGALQLIEVDHARQILFVHDRIKEAFYARLTDKEKKQKHIAIAHILDTELSPQDKTEMLYDIADHFIAAENPEKIREYGIPAAEKATMESAYEEALRLYKVMLRTIPNDLAFENYCLINIGKLQLSLGNYAEAIGNFDKLMLFQKTKLEEAQILQLLCDAYFHNGDYAKCEEYGKKGLQCLGEALPTKKSALFLSAAKEFVLFSFYELQPTIRVRSKYLTDAEKIRNKLIIAFYYALTEAYSKNAATKYKFVRACLRMYNLARPRLGEGQELATSIAATAGPFMALGFFDKALSLQTRALQMNQHLHARWGENKAFRFSGFTHDWAGRHQDAIASFSQALAISTKIADTHETTDNYSGLIHSYYCLGDYTNEEKYIKLYYDLVLRSKDNYGIFDAYISNLCLYHETGRLEDALFWGQKVEDLADTSDNLKNVFAAYMELGYLYLDGLQNKDKAKEYLEKAAALYSTAEPLANYSINIHTYLAELYLAEYSAAPSTEKLKQLANACKKALYTTKAWPNHYGGALRITAKYYALIGNRSLAEKYFNQSIEHCAKTGRRYEQNKGLYEYGCFLHVQKDAKQTELGTKKLTSAFTGFSEIGATHYAKRSAEKLGGEYSLKQKDLQLVESIQLESFEKMIEESNSTIEINDLLPRLVKLAAEATGAAQAYIFLYDEADRALRPRAGISATEENTTKYPSGVIDAVFTNQQELISADAVNDHQLVKIDSAEKELRTLSGIVANDIHSLLCFPILIKTGAKETPVGVFYLDNPTKDFFSGKERTIKTINTLTKNPIANALLYEAQQKSLKKEQFFSAQFRKYMAPDMIRQIVEQEKPATLGGASVKKAIVFSDIRDFTSISEHIGNAEDILGILNSYFQTMEDCIKDDGYIDKYIGDGMMVLFDTPHKALQSAISMKHALADYNSLRQKRIAQNQWTWHGKTIVNQINNGIGISFGDILLGNMGNTLKYDYTVIGEPVNIASRLEGLTKIYRSPILIDDATYQAVTAANDPLEKTILRKADRVRVKGKSHPIEIYEEISGLPKIILEHELQTLPEYTAALELYLTPGNKLGRLNDWKTAYEYFEKIIQTTPQGFHDFISEIMLHRLDKMMRSSLDYWDGVFTFTEK